MDDGHQMWQQNNWFRELPGKEMSEEHMCTKKLEEKKEQCVCCPVTVLRKQKLNLLTVTFCTQSKHP